MIKHLNNQRDRKNSAVKAGVHLNDEGKMATELTHEPTVGWLKKALQAYLKMKGRALDAGCGDARLVKHVFALIFKKIDMFDPDA